MTTKLELTQLLAQRNTELEAARMRISVLEGELALRPQRQHRAAPQQWQRPAHMEAARQRAMANGCVVKL